MSLAGGHLASAATPCPSGWNSTDGSRIPTELAGTQWSGPFRYSVVTGTAILSLYNFSYVMNVR
jgi:hypothetical protein